MPTRTRLVLAALSALALACHDSSSGSGSAAGGGGGSGGAGPTELGGPIPGLTPEELAAFERGKLVFERRFKPSEGLGPFYNATSCQSCHSDPVTGGSAQLYRNFYLCKFGPPASQFGLDELPSPVVPAFGTGFHTSAHFTLEGGRIVMPPDYLGLPAVVAQRNAIPVFGVGLFEFVSDATILALSDPNDADGDGISGRHNTDVDGTIGRFGVKAQSNNIELFTRAPLQNQLGVTTDPFLGSGGLVHLSPLQVSTDPNDPTLDNDGVPDPELGHDDLGDLIAFTRFLAPPQKKPFDVAARRGEQLFDSLGCVKCHVPELPSSRGPVPAYTDLLLHYMGDDLADGLTFGIPQISSIDPMTSHREFRTQPLWGVSLHAPFLHDGRAETLEQAILAHGGEARASRDAFRALPAARRAHVIAFLEHL